MKYVSLMLLLTCAPLVHAMDDDAQAVLPEPGIIKHELDYGARCVAFSPTDNSFLTAYKDIVYTYEGNSDKPVKERVCGDVVHDVLFSPSGDKIVTRLSNGAVKVQHSDQCGSSLSDFGSAPFLFKFNSRGDFIRQTDDTTIKIAYETEEIPGRFILELQDQVGRISSASIDDNGHVAVASKGKVCVWDYKRTKLIKEFRYRNDNITFVRLNAAGDKIFIGFWPKGDQYPAGGEVWDMKINWPLYSVPSADRAEFIDDKLVVKSGLHHVVIFHASTGDRLKDVPPSARQKVDSCAFSSNNKYFAQSDTERVSLYDVEGNMLSQIKHDGDVTVEAVSPRGDSLAVRSARKTSIWRLVHLMKKQTEL